jgi:hypothetical protein
MDTNAPPSPPPAPTGPPLLLGIFIVGQLVFLTAINLVDMARDARDELPRDTATAIERVVPGWTKQSGHAHDLTEQVYNVAKRWSQVSGQLQGWSLFAPNIGRHCVFPSVLLLWDEEPLSAPGMAHYLAPLAAASPLEAAVLAAGERSLAPPEPTAHRVGRHLAPLAASDQLQAAVLRVTAALTAPPGPPSPTHDEMLSDNEPRDVNAYFRAGHFRLRRYEGNLVDILRPLEDETPAETAERWQKRIAKHVRKYGDVIHAYLRWRLEAYREEHPDRPEPRQAVLLVRRWTIADRKQAPPYWHGPYIVPVARWQPHVTWARGHGPLEAYDPVRQRFETP